MKKLLLSIFGIFFGLSAFCSAEEFIFSGSFSTEQSNYGYIDISFSNFGSPFYLTGFSFKSISGDPEYVLGQLDRIVDSLSGAFSNITGFVLDYSWGGTFIYFSFDPVLIQSSFSFRLNWFTVLEDGYANEYYAFRPFSSFIPGLNMLISTSDPSYGDNIYLPFYSIFGYSVNFDSFTINYGSTSKEYTITEDIDIFINSPVVKNGNTFSFDGSTGINLVYNGSYNWYTKNKLYLDGQFWFNQGVFTPICL